MVPAPGLRAGRPFAELKPAGEYQQIREGLYCWQAYDPSVKADLWSTALRLGEALVFIDPIPLEPLAELGAGLQPAAVIVTNGNHGRAAVRYGEMFNIPVITHADVADGGTVLDELTIIHLPGNGAGEIAVHSRQGGGILTVGDALIHLDALEFLPAKYCEQPKLARASLQKLLRFPCEVMTFAHGMPIPSGAGKRLRELLS